MLEEPLHRAQVFMALKKYPCKLCDRRGTHVMCLCALPRKMAGVSENYCAKYGVMIYF